MTVTAASLAVEFDVVGLPEATRALDTVDRKVRDSAASAKAGGAALLGMAGVAALGFKNAIGVTMDFDKQLSAIASVGGKDAQSRLEEIRATALKLGADTAFSASEAAGGMEEMIKAGLSVQDVLGGAAQAALDLSAASGTAVEESATIMSSMLNVFSDTLTQFSTEGEKATYIADLLAQAANASATDVHGLGYALQASAAIARGFGLTAQDTATALAILAQNGMASSDMGTSLKSMLLSTVRETKPAKTALAELGLSFEDLQDSAGQFIGINEMMALFRQGAAESGVSGMDLNRILNKVFGSDGGRAAQIFFRTTNEGWDGMRDGMNNAGTAQEQAAERLDNLAGDAEKLRGSLETLTLSFTRFTTGPLRRGTQLATEFINAISGLPPEAQQIIVIMGGLGTVVAGAVGVWALFGDKIMLAVRGLMLLSGPLLIVAGLVAALYVAWQNNWGGIQEITQGAVSGIGETIGRMSKFFQAARERGLEPFHLVLRTLIVSLNEQLGRDNPLSNVLRGILRNGQKLADWISETGIPKVQEFLDLFTSGDFEGAGDVLGGLLTDLKGGWDKTVGPWIEERKSQALGFAATWMQQIVTGFQGINWDLVGNAVQTGLQTGLGVLGGIGGWIKGKIDEVDWEPVKGTLQTGAQLAAFGIITGAQNGILSLQNLGGWVGDRLAEVDWDTVGATLDTAARLAFFGIIRGAQDELAILVNIGAWALEQIGKVDWSAVLTALTTKGGELIGAFMHGAQDFWNNTLGPWLQAAFPALLTWLTTDGLPPIVAGLVTGGADLIGGIVQGLTDHWPEIQDFFIDVLLPGIPALLLAAPILLLGAGYGIIRGLLTGLQDVWNNDLSPWLHTVIDGLPDLFQGASDWLMSHGQEVVDGLLRGMQDTWNNQLSPWLHGVIDGIPGLLANAGTWLVAGGSALIDGLRHGAQDFWNNTLGPWFDSLGGAVLKRFADAATWLVDAGRDIVQGLWDGAKERWQDFMDWWSTLEVPDPAGDARRNVGPGDPDKPAGSRAWGGPVSAWRPYLVGERGPELFVPQMSGYIMPNTPSVAPMSATPASTSGGAGGGGQVIHQVNNISVRLDELEEMVEAARFVRDLDTARTLYLGGVA